MSFLSGYSPTDLSWIGFSLFLIGMSKGGFPVGSIALPLLILIWPDQSQAARSAIGFMLPMLCIMDLVAMGFYWRQVKWKRVVYLLPASVVGVGLASLLFVSDTTAMISVSDRVLKLLIGALGILFVVYFAAKKWIFQHVHIDQPNWGKGSVFGFFAGITSTLAHAAGPVIQMYLLPQQLDKKIFAATSCAFFWILNLVKLYPFLLFGRINTENLKLGTVLLPLLPLGVLAGWILVRKTQQKHYTLLIYLALLVASASLIIKAL